MSGQDREMDEEQVVEQGSQDGTPADDVAHDEVAADAPADADAVEAADAGDAEAMGEAAEGDAPVEPGVLTEQMLEALLFVAEKPLSRQEIGRLARVDRETVDAAIGDLEMSLSDRGLRLLVAGERVELATSHEAGALIARYVGADVVRLSPAALETLAIVAYRQPITKAGIERIRGVDSDYTVRALLHRRLIAEQGRSESPGRPILYGTGFEFLERFGLTSIEELPPLDLDVAARLVDGVEGAGDGASPAAGDALTDLARAAADAAAGADA